MPVHNFDENRIHNKDYLRLKYVTKEEQNLIEKFPKLKKALVRVKHKCMLDEQIRSKDFQDPNFSRLYYVRYADDFLLGYVRSKIKARDIYEQVVNFFYKTNYHLNAILPNPKLHMYLINLNI